MYIVKFVTMVNKGVLHKTEIMRTCDINKALTTIKHLRCIDTIDTNVIYEHITLEYVPIA